MSHWSFPSIVSQATYVVLGLGETGLAAALWCLEQGACVRILDTRVEPACRAELDASGYGDRIEYRLGPEALVESALIGTVAVVLSPGLSPHQEPVKSLLVSADQQGIEIIGEIELFARALADLSQQGYRPDLLGVTGTNGKTTVTSLTCRLLQAAGKTAVAAGNISPAALSVLRDSVRSQVLPQAWVLELSSFQLHTLSSLVLDAAVVLNVTQDHLDWHGSMQAYADAKARLLNMSRIKIVNRDDPATLSMIEALDSPDTRSFGRFPPEYEGDMGLEEDHGVVWLAASCAVEDDGVKPVARSKRQRQTSSTVARSIGRVMRLMPADALHIRGRHNALNVLAALALVRSVNIGWADALQSVRDYRGEPHRAEFVRSVAGVDFINDSKGTNVGATVAALEGMGRGVVLIAGGLGKGQDFAPLARAIESYAKAVVLIGQDAPVIADSLHAVTLPVHHAATLELAVEVAFRHAQPGDAVMLSPACASMDMFRNYGHRGCAFVEAVQELALQQGEIV